MQKVLRVSGCVKLNRLAWLEWLLHNGKKNYDYQCNKYPTNSCFSIEDPCIIYLCVIVKIIHLDGFTGLPESEMTEQNT